MVNSGYILKTLTCIIISKSIIMLSLVEKSEKLSHVHTVFTFAGFDVDGDGDAE